MVPVRASHLCNIKPAPSLTCSPPRAARMMIFVPILLLQITIFFWSYRIGRIVFKLIKGTSATECVPPPPSRFPAPSSRGLSVP